METKQTMHWKQNLLETKQFVVICTATVLLLLQKFWKIGKPGKFFLLISCIKNHHFITFLLKWELFSWGQKFLFFSKIKSTTTVSHPKGLTWHFIEIKAIKHDYYSSLNMWTHKNSKDKYWVFSEQAHFFNAFSS